MSDIEKFIGERKARNPKAWAGFEEKYRKFAIGAMLAEHREKAGISLSEFSRRTKIKKPQVSRLENHGDDVRLSTITRYVEATGKPLTSRIHPGRVRSKGRLAAKADEGAGRSEGRKLKSESR